MEGSTGQSVCDYGLTISCVVVVYMKVVFCLQGEGHGTVVRKSVVYLLYLFCSQKGLGALSVVEDVRDRGNQSPSRY